MSNYDVASSNLDFFLARLDGNSNQASTEIIELPENLPVEKIPSMVPELIQKSFERLETIKKQIAAANQQADLACEAAEDAYTKEVGFWHRTTPAIEALQSAVMSQSNAQIQLSKAQCLMFEQQQLLANFSKVLFLMCAANLGSARIAVKEIKMRLENASEEEISSMARQELGKVFQQLKQQMDILENQERLQAKVAKLEQRLYSLENLQSHSCDERTGQNTSIELNGSEAVIKKKSNFWKNVCKIGAIGLAIWGFCDLRNGRWIMTIIEEFAAFMLWACNDDSSSDSKKMQHVDKEGN